jgi:hypothetical protein
MAVKKSKIDKMPARRMPEGFEFPKTKKPVPKIAGAKTGIRTPLAKATPKPTAKATTKPMTASEKAFIKNQKEKAKATKRTGVYPNTAN